MRDHGIAYGFTESAVHSLALEALSSQIRSFIEKNPNLLHEDANVAWLLNDSESGKMVQKAGSKNNGQVAGDHGRPRNDFIFEGFQYGSVQPVANWKQKLLQYADDSQIDPDDDDGTGSLAESFTGWLMGLCECCGLYPTFELGSLAFFRSPGHQALMDHLDILSDTLSQSPVDDVPVHSLSASMFLPKQSVWNFRKKITRRIVLQPTPLPAPVVQRLPLTRGDFVTGLEEQFALWNQLAQDISRQSDSFGLKSGNTVIDERNFAIMRDSVGA